MLLMVMMVGLEGWVRAGETPEPVDSFGGWSEVMLGASPRFRIEEWKGACWLVTPEGHPFIGVAIAHANRPLERVRMPEDTTAARFGDNIAAYAKDRAEWMKSAGFNAFSYTVPEDESVRVPWIATLALIPGFINFGPRPVDLFDPAWRENAAAIIKRQLPQLLGDKDVIGVSLSYPVLFSPHVVPQRMWERLARSPTNLLRELKAMDRSSAGKRAYVDYLKTRYASVQEYVRQRAPRFSYVRNFDELLPADLGADDPPFELHPDDAPFYTAMWRQAIAFLVAEIRKQSPDIIIFSPRVIGLHTFPDPWFDAWLAGVGDQVDAFLPELFASDDYRGIIARIGEVAGRPSFVADGMRPQEFNYAIGAEADRAEAESYRKMFTALIASRWYLGGTVCEYRPHLPEFRWYAAELERPRTGIREANYIDRPELFSTYRELHGEKYHRKLQVVAP